MSNKTLKELAFLDRKIKNLMLKSVSKSGIIFELKRYGFTRQTISKHYDAIEDERLERERTDNKLKEVTELIQAL